MTKWMIRMVVVGALLFSGGAVQAKGTPDYRAGYHDGCSSAKGHYTRSVYKYRHSGIYRSAWRKGKRNCKRGRVSRHRPHRTLRHRVKSCNTEAPWVAFQRGWDDGYRSAKGEYRRSGRGCASYRHGWVSGYRSCHCAEQRKPDSYVEGYHDGCASGAWGENIREDKYRKSTPRYRKGWMQGYSDCQPES